jgi:hypothetical protein
VLLKFCAEVVFGYFSLLANSQIQFACIKSGLAVVVSTELKECKSVLVCGQRTVLGLVEIDETAFDNEHDHCRLW